MESVFQIKRRFVYFWLFSFWSIVKKLANEESGLECWWQWQKKMRLKWSGLHLDSIPFVVKGKMPKAAFAITKSKEKEREKNHFAHHRYIHRKKNGFGLTRKWIRIETFFSFVEFIFSQLWHIIRKNLFDLFLPRFVLIFAWTYTA